VDFNWFTHERFDPLTLAQELRDEGIAVVIDQTTTGTLHGLVGGVQVSLIRHNYPLLTPLRTWRKIRIAARADLAAMKLAAIAQRGAKKDFVDVCTLGLDSDSLAQMLAWHRQKYSIEDISHLLCGLNYFDDANRERLPLMLCDLDWRSVKRTIQRWLKEVPR
jgi:hypothetical protein